MPGKKSDPQSTDEIRISKMELELQARLAPVKPDPEFIRHLGSRLSQPSTMGLEPETPFSDLAVALAIAGGGIVLFVLVLRVVYEILKAVGIVRTGREREE
jgi:hypothetical protein